MFVEGFMILMKVFLNRSYYKRSVKVIICIELKGGKIVEGVSYSIYLYS